MRSDKSLTSIVVMGADGTTVKTIITDGSGSGYAGLVGIKEVLDGLDGE